MAEQLRLTRPAAAPAPSTRYTPPLIQLQRLNTSRLLPARYSDSVLTRIADSDQDLQLIYALDNATNERLIAETNSRLGLSARELVVDLPYARIVNAAFAHPHPQGARFSTPYRGAWYAGFELATAKAEVLFHRSVQLTEIGWMAAEELDYDHYQADFAGPFHDLRDHDLRDHDPSQDNLSRTGPDERHPYTAAASQPGAQQAGVVQTHPGPAGPDALGNEQRLACLAPNSYVASQQLAGELLQAGSLGVVYPSTRRSGGTCLACFRPAVVANVRKGGLHRLTWYPDAPPTFTRIARPASAGAAPALAAIFRPAPKPVSKSVPKSASTA